LLLCFEPVFAAITSWLVLHEQFSAMQIVGGGLIVGAMMLAALGERRHKSSIAVPQ
jgi:drug/metabolite transporter (DMT)-like permease